MKLPRPLLALAFIAGFSVLSAADKADTLPEQTQQALLRAGHAMRSIATEGGYLWRYSRDLSVRFGEEKATETQIWVQPPGTPAVGQAFLRAYAVTGDEFWLGAARDAALALVRGQLESGGWDYLVEFDPAKRPLWRYRDASSSEARPQATRQAPRNTSTYDDNNTQSAIRFFLAFLDAAKKSPSPDDARIREAADYGLKKLLEAQYPNGAWPQRWDGEPHDPAKYPVKPASIPTDYPREQPHESYYGHYTFNDNAHRDLLLTLVDAWHRTGDETYRDAARRAADYLILSQLPEPQPLWAQQYDANLQPAWARAFEPPAITTSESAGVIRLLVDMYLEFGDEKYLEPIPRAIKWLREHELSPGRWARLYELLTNRPIYGDRDKKIHYTLDEISEERRRGYSWEGEYGVAEAIAYYENVVAAGRDRWLAEHKQSRAERTSEADVRALIDALDGDGFWVGERRSRIAPAESGRWIDCGTFIRNVYRLCSYLESVSRQAEHP